MKHTSTSRALLCLAVLMVFVAPRPARADIDWGIVGKNCLKDLSGAGMGGLVAGPLGALFGGCAASLSLVVQPPGANENTAAPQKNPNNAYDWIGAMHNQVIRDYYKDHKSYDLKSFYQFAEKNKNRYGTGSMPSIEQVAQAVAASGDKDESIDDLYLRIDKQFKNAGINQNIVAQLRRIFSSKRVPGPTVEEVSANILQVENQSLNSRDLTKQQRLQISASFSVLRYSVALWGGTVAHSQKNVAR